MTDDLFVHLARFAGLSARAGLAIGVGDEVDAARALLLVDLCDRAEVRRALRVALKIRSPRLASLRGAVWPAVDVGRAAFHARGSPLESRDRRRSRTARPVARPRHPHGRRTLDPQRGRRAWLQSGGMCCAESRSTSAPPATWQPWKASSHGWLAACGPPQPAAGAVAPRPNPDLRRSFRRAIATGGEFLSLACRARAIERPRARRAVRHERLDGPARPVPARVRPRAAPGCAQ